MENLYLESISISNIRRFGEEVNIEVGKGATIFLAPNGTGKTSLFQAIELALTGGVSTLEGNVPIMKRIGATTAEVNLVFGDKSKCSVIWGANGFENSEPPKLLFGELPKEDIPYALRLTHFLDQADKDWIVQVQSDRAGDQLSHLSIAREAKRANSVMLSAKRTVTELLKTERSALELIDSEVKNWNRLKAKLIELKVEDSRPLIVFQELWKAINLFSKVLGFAEFSPAENISTLRSSFGETMATFEQRIDLLKRRAYEFEGLQTEIKRFRDLFSILEKVILPHLEKLILSKNEKELVLTTLKEEQTRVLEYHRDSKLRTSSFVAAQNRIYRLLEIRRRADELAEDVRRFEKQLAELDGKRIAASTRLDEAQKLDELHNTLGDRNKILVQRMSNLAEIQTALPKWLEEQTNLKPIEVEVLPTLLNLMVGAEADWETSKADLAKANTAIEMTERDISSLTMALGVVDRAVSDIVKNLPKDATDCPVCHTVFTAAELHEKMLASIKSTSPELELLQLRLEQEKQRAVGCASVENAAAALVGDLKDQIRVKEADLSRRKALLVSEIKSKADGCTNIVEANELVNRLEKEIEASRTLLDTEIASIPERPSDQSLAELNSEVRRLNSEIVARKEDENNAKAKQEENLVQQRTIEEDQKDGLGLDEIRALLITEEKERGKSQEMADGLKSQIELEQTYLNNISGEILAKEEEKRNIEGQISEVKARWSQQGMEGEPNVEALSNAKVQASQELSSLETRRQELNRVDNELSRWEASKSLLEVMAELDKIRGNKFENEFEANLIAKAERQAEKVQTIEHKQRTLIIFSDILQAKIDQTNVLTDQAKVLWSRLLYRTVIDPKFATTVMKTYEKYKKSHASISVRIEEAEYEVRFIASEAQLTDLQLTFLLTNAQRIAWTPWRALLLDDPTQHHDLVHASGVFDVLRDYIVDLDFQVLLATHDSVQAKYLVRKLQNDGVPVKLYSLYASENGVRARKVVDSPAGESKLMGEDIETRDLDSNTRDNFKE